MISKVNKLFGELDKLEVGEKIKIRQYVFDNWGVFDYFKKRSFDVTFCLAKKLLPSKKFEVNSFKITRIL